MLVRTTLSIAAMAAFAAGAAVGCSITGNGPWLSDSDLSGETTTEARDLDGFTAVSLGGNADLIVTQGDAFSVEVTADSALQEHVTTAVNGSTLNIRQEYSIVGASPTVTVTITVPRLTEVSLSGSSDATIAGVRGDSLHVTTSGSSDVRVDSEVGDLAIDVSGSSDFTVTGTADSTDISISGSGTVTGSGFTTAAARVSVTGSGDVTLRVDDTLDASISGSGSVIYYGDPTVDADTTGSGSIHRAED